VLRQRLVRHLNAATMASKEDEVNIKASVSTNLSGETIQVGPQNNDDNSHAGACAGSNSVFVELMRQVPRLSAEEPEAILRFIIRFDEIYALGLSDDRSFVVRILPLVSGTVLGFFGDCLRNGRTWEQCKSELLREFFPHFVRERMIQDLITFNFHEEGQSVREYIDRVFAAARILAYDVDEQQLVDRIVMSLHPHVLAQAAFLERPHS